MLSKKTVNFGHRNLSLVAKVVRHLWHPSRAARVARAWGRIHAFRTLPPI